jgi:hypothetical protein
MVARVYNKLNTVPEHRVRQKVGKLHFGQTGFGRCLRNLLTLDLLGYSIDFRLCLFTPFRAPEIAVITCSLSSKPQKSLLQRSNLSLLLPQSTIFSISLILHAVTACYSRFRLTL